MKKVLSSLELLNDVAICFTGEQLLASQVAVLTTIARCHVRHHCQSYRIEPAFCGAAFRVSD